VAPSTARRKAAKRALVGFRTTADVDGSVISSSQNLRPASGGARRTSRGPVDSQPPTPRHDLEAFFLLIATIYFAVADLAQDRDAVRNHLDDERLNLLDDVVLEDRVARLADLSTVNLPLLGTTSRHSSS
jgi:hypothetical protein